VAWGAAGLLLAGFVGLFFPPGVVQTAGSAALLAWCAALLGLTYLGYSALSVLHQAWGTALGGDAAQRARVVAWREGLALLGVVLASVLPALAGLGATCTVLGLALALGLWALARAPKPLPPPPAAQALPSQSLALPWRTPAFRALLGVYLLNGVASAVPATLVLFFIRDRLQAAAWEPLFLASYFSAAAASLPLWVKFIARHGLRPAWGAGMVLAVLSFSFAAWLGAGDVAAFWAVCAASGAALGADLAAPGALLAGVVQRAGHSGPAEGRYLGWWHFATKLNLALAAGLALPLLGLLGYVPGARDPAALQALALAYCALPCALKLAAAVLLWRWGPRIEPAAGEQPAVTPTAPPATTAHPAKAQHP
jgi:Na+/melibiose symporter-like transporter